MIDEESCNSPEAVPSANETHVRCGSSPRSAAAFDGVVATVAKVPSPEVFSFGALTHLRFSRRKKGWRGKSAARFASKRPVVKAVRIIAFTADLAGKKSYSSQVAFLPLPPSGALVLSLEGEKVAGVAIKAGGTRLTTTHNELREWLGARLDASPPFLASRRAVLVLSAVAWESVHAEFTVNGILWTLETVGAAFANLSTETELPQTLRSLLLASQVRVLDFPIHKRG